LAEDIFFFKRIEKKYIIDVSKKNELLALIGEQLYPDSHGMSTVSSLYLDTPDFRIIRASIEAKEDKSAYKEKLRIRSYGLPDYHSKVFFEIKKKYKGIVYKRREAMELRCVFEYIKNAKKPFDSQIMREIDYSMNYYGRPQPKMLISYERDAYYLKDFPNHRITFDKSVRYRTEKLTPDGRLEGKLIIPKNTVIMEIKTNGAMPIWLSKALDELKIYPSSFSKYGNSYKDYLKKENQYVTNF